VGTHTDLASAIKVSVPTEERENQMQTQKQMRDKTPLFFAI